MIERVAKAIFEANGSDYTWEETLSGNVEKDHEAANPAAIKWARDLAREAIKAMRPWQPEGRMCLVMDNKVIAAACDEFETWTDPTDGGALVAAFAAAIDAALAE